MPTSAETSTSSISTPLLGRLQKVRRAPHAEAPVVESGRQPSISGTASTPTGGGSREAGNSKTDSSPGADNSPIVYLAGHLGDWREPVQKRLREAGITVWTPVDNPQEAAAHYAALDLIMAKSANAVLAYIAPSHLTLSRGTHAEMGAAFANRVPIWVVWNDGPRVYEFTAAMAYRLFTDLDSAVESLINHFTGGK
jgi:hypothetical protein